jgi:hypothetical protein
MLLSNKTPVCSLADWFVLHNGISEQIVLLFSFAVDQHFSASDLPTDGLIMTTVSELNKGETAIIPVRL